MESLVKGSKIKVKEPVFGSSKNYLGDRTYSALILKENYGESGQHTFSLEILSSEGVLADKMPKKTTRKGRNLYKNLISVESPADYEFLKNEKAERKLENKEFTVDLNRRFGSRF